LQLDSKGEIARKKLRKTLCGNGPRKEHQRTKKKIPRISKERRNLRRPDRERGNTAIDRCKTRESARGGGQRGVKGEEQKEREKGKSLLKGRSRWCVVKGMGRKVKEKGLGAFFGGKSEV